LSFRVERLPLRARLTKGTFNGDRSWSLTQDDLADLAYLPADGIDVPPTISVRIVSLDGDYAQTLAVLDLPLSAVAVPPPVEPATPAHDAELQQLRNDIAAAQSTLAMRESEMATLRQKLADATAQPPRQAIDAELAAARAGWEAELQQRLGAAATDTAAQLEASRAAARAEQEKLRGGLTADAQQRIDEAQKRGREEGQAALAQAQQAWNAAAAKRFAAAEAQWRQQAAERIAAAEAQGRQQAVERVAAAETQWRQQSTQAIAEASARAERAEAALNEARTAIAVGQGKDAELQQLQGALAEAQKSLAAGQAALAQRERELAATQSAARLTPAASAADVEAAIATAQEKWKAAAARDLAAAEARWQEHSSQMLAEATARVERAEAALAEARAQLDPAREQHNEVERQNLRDALVTAQAALGQRESELAQAQASLAQVSQRPSVDVQGAIRKAEESWNAIAAQRFAAAEARWRQQATQAVVEATARAERAEAALAQAPIAMPAIPDPNAAAQLQQMREALAAIETKLAARESELAEARAATATAREEATMATSALQQAEAVHKAEAAKAAEEAGKLEEARKIEEARKTEAAKQVVAPVEAQKAAPAANKLRGAYGDAIARRSHARIIRRFVQASALAASLAAGFVLAPYAEILATDVMWPRFLTVAGEARDFIVPKPGEAPPEQEAAAAPQPRPAEPAVIESRWVIAVPTAKVRAGPSPAAGVVATLSRNIDVSRVDQRGSWVMIRFGDAADRQEGWVPGNFLKDMTGH